MVRSRDGANPAARSTVRSLLLAVVVLAATLAGAAGRPRGDGYWHAEKGTIVDASGAEVRFSGVSFGGFESENFALHGTWGGIGRNWKSYLDQMQSSTSRSRNSSVLFPWSSMGLKDHPFDVSKPSQVVYEVHDYGPDVFEQPWHDDPSFPANLAGYLDRTWGFVHDQGIGPVWIGEWGSRLDSSREQAWATALRSYIAGKGLSWTWWTWAPTSPDTGGILEDDWRTPWPQKLDLIGPVEYPGYGEPGPALRGGCEAAPPWSNRSPPRSGSRSLSGRLFH